MDPRIKRSLCSRGGIRRCQGNIHNLSHVAGNMLSVCGNNVSLACCYSALALEPDDLYIYRLQARDPTEISVYLQLSPSFYNLWPGYYS